jgi:hypothetical protein
LRLSRSMWTTSSALSSFPPAVSLRVSPRYRGYPQSSTESFQEPRARGGISGGSAKAKPAETGVFSSTCRARRVPSAPPATRLYSTSCNCLDSSSGNQWQISLQTRQDIGQRPAPPSANDPRKAALETLRAAFSSLPPLFKERSHRHTFLRSRKRSIGPISTRYALGECQKIRSCSLCRYWRRR